MTQCYEFIDIKVSNEKIQARPVAWDREIYDGFGNDRNGQQVDATEFQATCPFCGNLIHFAKAEVYLDRYDDDSIKCVSCGAGSQAKVGGTPTSKAPKTATEIQSKKMLFLDPIGSGLFDLEIDQELFEKVESAESD